MVNGHPQSAEIAKSAAYPFSIYVKNGYWNGREEGLAVLSRFEIEGAQHFELPLIPGDMPRRLQVCMLRTNPAALMLNTHLAFHITHGEGRLRQAEAINDVLRERRERGYDNVILCGDLNDEPTSPAVSCLRQSLLTAEEAHSHSNMPEWQNSFSSGNQYVSPALWPNCRIDYVMLSRQINVIDVRIVLDGCDGWHPVSDHYGILATVKY